VRARTVPAALLLLLAVHAGCASEGTAQAPGTFAARIAALSERGGYFDTDNLISNERSYLQVLPDLRNAGIRGGAYIGVGPDTNFSYIAEVRPAMAFIIDVRRDNLLLHLLFKSLFAISESRIEYLAYLLGRPAPPAIDGWRAAPIDRIAAYLDRAAPSAASLAASRRRIERELEKTGVPLSAEDLATIAGFHQRFMDAGLELRFNSTGRPPQFHYPTYRDLLLETDSRGQQGNYLASEAGFQFVRSLQVRDLVIPVVGDLGGPSAMAAIGRLLAERGERLTAFYASNVEFYLYGQGTFPRFVANLRQIPHTNNSVLIRSVFGRYSSGWRDGSSSQLHPIDDLLAGASEGRFRSYGALVDR
jgi:hypothetical protein